MARFVEVAKGNSRRWETHWPRDVDPGRQAEQRQVAHDPDGPKLL